MLQSRLNPSIVFTSFLLLSPFAASQTNEGLIDLARNTFRLNAGIEFAGVFWIGCELAILFCMSVATRHLLAKTIPSNLLLTRRDKSIAIGCVVFFVLLCVAVFARHFFIDPLPDAITKILEQNQGESVADIKSAYIFRTRTHLFIWCLFITGWVALEIAIVLKGVRAYRALHQLFGGHRGV